MLESDGNDGVANALRALERRHAADPEEESELAGEPFCLFRIARETMNDAAQGCARTVAFVRGEVGREIVERITQVKDRRVPALARVAHLGREHATLRVARAVIVVVVEAHLADRARRARPRRDQRVEGRRDIVGRVARFVRVDADGVVQAVPRGGRLSRGTVGHVGSDGQDARDAGGARACEHRVAVGVECGIVNVGVGVEHHGVIVA